jgi:hypothetical protein
MAKKKAPKRGGYRKGSGRKPRDTQLVGWRLRRSTVAAVKARAAREGCQPGALVDQILSTALAGSGPTRYDR